MLHNFLIIFKSKLNLKIFFILIYILSIYIIYINSYSKILWILKNNKLKYLKFNKIIFLWYNYQKNN